MSANLDDLKRKRDQLNARIQQAEARMRAGQKKAEDRVKVLVGAAILQEVREGRLALDELLGVMGQFLARPTERTAVLGDDGKGSDTLRHLVGGKVAGSQFTDPTHPSFGQ